MKALLCLGIVLLALPLRAQDDDGGGLFGDNFEFEVGVSESRGERRGESRRPSGPSAIDQLNEILSGGGHPLSAEQRRQIQEKLEAQIAEMRQAAPQPAAARPAGLDTSRTQHSEFARQQEEKFIANFLPVLTTEQADIWKEFRKQKIRSGGGYPALKLVLEEAGAPPSSEQEAQLQAAFRSYAERLRDLRESAAASGVPEPRPDPAALKAAEDEYLSALLKILNADQRRALLEWRRSQQTPPGP